jgi:putative permease
MKLQKETLIKTLMIVSIVTVFIIGFTQFKSLTGDFLSNLYNAAKSVIIPFSIAFLLSFIVGPLAKLIEKKLKLNQSVSIIIAIAIGLILIVGLLSITVSFIIIQIGSMIVSISDQIDEGVLENILTQGVDLISQYFDTGTLSDYLNNLEQSNVNFQDIFDLAIGVFLFIFNITTSIIHFVFTIVLTPVFMYYLIKDREKVFTSIGKVFPKKSQRHLKVLAKESDTVIRGYFLGHGQVMLFITIFFMITYTILSFFIPNFSVIYAILFALVMGMFSIIPYLGVWISMSMPITLLLTLYLENGSDDWIYLIGIIMVLLLNVIEEMIESSLVQPRIFSHTVHIHPLAVLSSFIFFGGMFGLVGVILAVPLAGIIKSTYSYLKELN